MAKRILRMSASPSFAAFAAVPHLEKLRTIDASLDVRFEARNTNADFETENVDAATRNGDLKVCGGLIGRVLGLAARAIQAVVDPLGRTDIEARDDEANVEAEHRRLNTVNGAPFAIPGLCPVARLGIAAVLACLIRQKASERLASVV
jgi:hypothetical protein